MKLWMIENNRDEDSFRIVDNKNKSHFKGTKKECKEFLKVEEDKKEDAKTKLEKMFTYIDKNSYSSTAFAQVQDMVTIYFCKRMVANVMEENKKLEEEIEEYLVREFETSQFCANYEIENHALKEIIKLLKANSKYSDDEFFNTAMKVHDDKINTIMDSIEKTFICDDCGEEYKYEQIRCCGEWVSEKVLPEDKKQDGDTISFKSAYGVVTDHYKVCTHCNQRIDDDN